MLNGTAFRLVAVERELRQLKTRVAEVEAALLKLVLPKPCRVSDVADLPIHLRKSYLVLAERGELDAEGVSAGTGRARAAESAVLNQLVELGWVGKRRVSHRIRFFVVREAKDPLTLLV